jgi:NAD(P)-dependent dehydrogenase (short-subunit alcohol dehydrogenase family)
MEITKYFSTDLLDGKTVFITGGGGDITLAMARNYAAVGANIAICGRTQETLDKAAPQLRELGAQVYAEACDVRDFDALERVIANTKEAIGPIDVLVCGAAGNFLAPAEKLSANGFKTVIDIDLIGSFNASRAALEQLKETKGSILFISAGQAFTPYYLQVHAAAAKAGIDNMMKNLAMEWGRYGIRCNSIAPGPIDDTEGMRRLSGVGMHEKFIATIPLGRYGTKDDIGQAAVFLASPMASNITGTVLVSDGGQNLPGGGVMGMFQTG